MKNRRSLLKMLVGAVAGCFVAPQAKAATTIIPSPAIQASIEQTSAELMRKTLEQFNSDPEIARFIREYALRQIEIAVQTRIAKKHSEFRKRMNFGDWT